MKKTCVVPQTAEINFFNERLTYNYDTMCLKNKYESMMKFDELVGDSVI